MRLRVVLAVLLLPSAAWAQSEIIGNGAGEELMPGAQVVLAPAGIDVQSGGKLSMNYWSYGVGQSTITSGVASGVPINVLSGGTIDLQYGRLESISTLTVASGAKVIRMRDVVFTDLPGMNPGATPWIDLSGMSSADRENLTFSFNRVTFSDPQATPTRINIKAGATTPLLRMLGSPTVHGNRWGEAFNNDPANAVRWYSGAVARTSPAGTFNTVEDALKDPGTSAASTISVNLGLIMIDDYINFGLVPGGATSTGPVVKNACVAPMGSNLAVWGGGVAPLTPIGKMVNCVIARGEIQGGYAENCTFFSATTGVVVENVRGTNCLTQNVGASCTWSSSVTNATSAFFDNAVGYDFHLSPSGGSAAIDEGVVLGTPTDVDGEARGFDGKPGGSGSWDIGACEFTAPVMTTLSQATNNNKPLIQVTATTGRVVVFFRNGVSMGTVTAAAGAASLADPVAEPDGIYTYTAAYQLSENRTGSPTSTPAIITIDTVAPAVAGVTSTTANGSYAQGAVINITVTFSEPVVLQGGNLQVTLNTGVVVAIAPFGPASSASGTYTVGAGQNTADLTATSPLTLAAGATLRDPAGNGATLTIPANQNLGNLKDIVIDTTPPSIASVTSTTANGTYTVGAVINVTVNFSEPVTLAGGNLQVSLNTGAVVAIGPFGPGTSATGTYTVAAGQNTADLNAITPLALQTGATLKDKAGNASGLSVPAGQNLGDLKNIVIDTAAPTVLNVTSTTANGTYGQGASINVTVTFSEAVTLVGGNLVVALNTGSSVSITPFGPATSAAGTYVVQADQSTPDLNASTPLTLSGGTLRDAAGNNAVLAVPAGQNLGDLKNIVIKTAPQPPTNIRVTAYATAVDIEWDPSPSPSTNVAGYNVYRRPQGTTAWGTPLNKVLPLNNLVGTTKFRDTTAAANTAYDYQVTAVGP